VSQSIPRTHGQSMRQSRFDRATARSDEQARLGNLPRVVRTDATATVWAVCSRGEAGHVHLVTESASGEMSCECVATGPCWHLRHVSRALAGEIGTLAPKPRIDISALMNINLHGRRSS